MPETKESGIVVDQREARGLADGSITRIVRVCKEELWSLLDEIEKVNGHPAWQCMDFDVRCPFDADRLWVRETWQAWEQASYEYGDCDVLGSSRISEITDQYREHPESMEADRAHNIDGIEYRATSDSLGPWRSSAVMPKWASRTLLDVTDVRVVRVQEITEEVAKATGLLPLYRPARGYDEDQDAGPSFALALRKLYGEDKWLWLATVAKIDVNATGQPNADLIESQRVSGAPSGISAGSSENG